MATPLSITAAAPPWVAAAVPVVVRVGRISSVMEMAAVVEVLPTTSANVTLTVRVATVAFGLVSV